MEAGKVYGYVYSLLPHDFITLYSNRLPARQTDLTSLPFYRGMIYLRRMRFHKGI
jgi:hypothetical protein